MEVCVKKVWKKILPHSFIGPILPTSRLDKGSKLPSYIYLKLDRTSNSKVPFNRTKIGS